MKPAPAANAREAIEQLAARSTTVANDGVGLHKIEQMLRDHERYRRRCINLIASENITSPAVARLQNNELSHRYGDYRGTDQQARKYQGNRHIARLEEYVTDL